MKHASRNKCDRWRTIAAISKSNDDATKFICAKYYLHNFNII